jgi:hypothetical protein
MKQVGDAREEDEVQRAVLVHQSLTWCTSACKTDTARCFSAARAQARQKFFAGIAFLLEGHAVGVQKYSAAIAKLGADLRLKRHVRVVGHRNPKLVRPLTVANGS